MSQKYVPPHLRNKGGATSSAAAAAAASPSSGAGAGGSTRLSSLAAAVQANRDRGSGTGSSSNNNNNNNANDSSGNRWWLDAEEEGKVSSLQAAASRRRAGSGGGSSSGGAGGGNHHYNPRRSTGSNSGGGGGGSADRRSLLGTSPGSNASSGGSHLMERRSLTSNPFQRNSHSSNNNNNNNTNDSSSRKHNNTSNPSSTLSSLESAARFGGPKILFFGDSFVRLFGLVKHHDLRVTGFKGATSKGLGKNLPYHSDGTPNISALSTPSTLRILTQKQAQIVQHIKKNRPERVVLCFGSVDVHLSWYFTKYTKMEGELFLPDVANRYMHFVASLLTLMIEQQELQQQQASSSSNETSSTVLPTIHVIGVYPSPLQPEYMSYSLANYGVTERDTIISEEDASIESRQNRVRLFNATLQAACEKYQQSNEIKGKGRLIFDCAFDDVLDPTTQLLKPSYTDISTHNIHLVWETTVLLWLDRWEWYKQLAPPDLIPSLQKTLEEYLQTKPWAAERAQQHVATNLGVQGAVLHDQKGVFDRDEA